jgi:homoserine kinase
VNGALRASCRVRVPATTANLGPGFDCLGMALDLWNDLRFSLVGDGVKVTTVGEHSESLPTDETNLVARSFLRLYEEAGVAPPAGLTVHCDLRVPPSSGLGSSAAAAVAGLLGANTILGGPFDEAHVLELAAEIDGHPDNVAATLLGGLTIVVRKEEKLLTKKILVPEAHVALVVPALAFSTHTARAGLPAQVSMKDAVFNLGRTPLVVEALRTGDLELLGQVMEDRLHQAARLKIIPGGRVAWDAALQAGAAAVAISGSGPSLIAFVGTAPDALRVGRAMADAFGDMGVVARPLGLSVSAVGASASA